MSTGSTRAADRNLRSARSGKGSLDLGHVGRQPAQLLGDVIEVAGGRSGPESPEARVPRLAGLHVLLRLREAAAIRQTVGIQEVREPLSVGDLVESEHARGLRICEGNEMPGGRGEIQQWCVRAG